MSDNQQASSTGLQLPRHSSPFDWQQIHADIQRVGGVILVELFPAEQVALLNSEIGEFLAGKPGAGLPETGSEEYDQFLGTRTVRLQGLIEKSAAAAQWIGNQDLHRWAAQCMEQLATSVLLSAGEYIQIGPGEPRQFLHRDTDSWAPLPIAADPFVVNAIVALDEFTADNGATWLVPGSAAWPPERKAKDNEGVQAVMGPGDAVLFRGDTVHGGGANHSQQPRRAVSISYCAGWLRPVESGLLNTSRDRVRELPENLQELLGYRAYDGSAQAGGMLGLYENGDPSVLLS